MSDALALPSPPRRSLSQETAKAKEMPATFMESDVLLMALCNVMRVAHDRESDQAAMSKKELTLAK